MGCYLGLLSWAAISSCFLGLLFRAHLGLSWPILNYLSQSQSNPGYIRLSKLSWAISGYLRLSQAISVYLCLSLIISGCFYQVSSIRVQVEEGESKLLPFETFPCFFFFIFFLLLTGVIEELALLKICGKKNENKGCNYLKLMFLLF